MENLFAKNTLVVNQKFTVLNNQYQVLDAEGKEIGYIQEKSSLGRNILQFIVSKKMLPFELNILDESKNVIASITKGITFFMAKITVKNSKGVEIAKIAQKFSLKPKFEITDMQGNKIATIAGDWFAWDFHITDSNGTEIGTVSKKWGGLLKEVFTDSDKYVVNISDSLTEENQRIAVLSTAVVIDMILKEQNN